MNDVIISKRNIDGKDIYRIHHVYEDKLVGLEAVEKSNDGKMKKIYNWNDGGEIEDFMNETEDVVMVSEIEKKAIEKFLGNFTQKGQKELAEFLEEKNMRLTSFITTPYGYYGFSETNEKTEQDPEKRAYQSYKVVLDREGHFKRLDQLVTQEDLTTCLVHLSNEMEKGNQTFFQIAPLSNCAVKRMDDNSLRFMFIHEDKENNEVKTTLEEVHYLEQEEGTMNFISPEEPLDEKEKEFFIREMMSIFTGVPDNQLETKE